MGTIGFIKAVTAWSIGNYSYIFYSLLQHLYLTFVSLTLASMVGILVGVFISKYSKIAGLVIGISNLGQMFPSLAILAFVLPLFGIGVKPAVIALFIKAILPILKNTYVGITNVDRSILEAGIGMGMTRRQILLKVELPLGLYVIMAGIKTSAVLCVSLATLSSLIGAGGLGDIIFSGIHMMDGPMLTTGSALTGLLAISAYGILGYIENAFTPRGIRR